MNERGRMSNQNGITNNFRNTNNGGSGERKVAVAIKKNKGSKEAMKWALDNILTPSQTVTLIHVNNHTTHSSSLPVNAETTPRNEPSDGAADLFLSFRCYCSRKQVLWETVTLEEQDIAKALIDYVRPNRINTLVLSAPSRNNISRLFKIDIPSLVLKGAPSFCNVYVIAKGKASSFRGASHSIRTSRTPRSNRYPRHVRFRDDLDSIGRASNVRTQDEWSLVENERFSCSMSQDRMSTDSSILSFYNNLSTDLEPYPPKSFSGPLRAKCKFSDIDTPTKSSLDKEIEILPCSTQNNEDLEEKMRRLDLQMKQTMDMYHAACKEALTAKQKAKEFQHQKLENDMKLVEAEKAKKDAFAALEEEKENSRVAHKRAKAAYRIAGKEKQKRMLAEMKASEEDEHKKMMLEFINQSQSLLRIVTVFLFFYVYFFYLSKI